ncbi:hypothetical protein EV360DRAFT_74091 [Lentinula raphanica]|nr:hypothetical protein EV360DRAFT_74091 [Lentinula raphanica]
MADLIRICSTGKCNAELPPKTSYKFNTCSNCREKDKLRKAKSRATAKRQRDEIEEPEPRPAPVQPQFHNDDSDEGMHSNLLGTQFDDAEALFQSLKKVSKGEDIVFHGYYTMSSDPLISDKERVKIIIHEIWQVTGYRFTVHDHPKMATGFKTRLWCSQDSRRKKAPKPKDGESIKHRDNVGMQRFNCNSRLTVTSRLANVLDCSTKLVSVHLEHHHRHVPYYNVSMSPEAAQIIRENLVWSTPSSLVPKVQQLYPEVTAAQIHSAWTVMSEELWKKEKMQLPSASALLEDYRDEVDVFEVTAEDGIEMLSWGMKKIVQKLDVRVNAVEIALDATYETNAKHLELYALMSTVFSRLWIVVIQENASKLSPNGSHTYGTDTDCAHDMRTLIKTWRRSRKAIRERINKGKLSTTPYNAERAHSVFAFIARDFVPPGRPDPGEHEGGREGGGRDTTKDTTDSEVDPNAIFIRLPATQPRPSQVHIEETVSLKIRIPPLGTLGTTEDGDQESSSRRNFCPQSLRDSVVAKIEAHRHAHPLIPGYSAPTSQGIYHWAVKQMYNLCVEHDLRELWAYLWENWYRPRRWKLWARSTIDEITILKTTMICESHWRRIKHDFLHHFHKPRLDLLVWILITKLAPAYYRKLDLLLTNTGRYRELSSWRKPFKKEWRRPRVEGDVDRAAHAEDDDLDRENEGVDDEGEDEDSEDECEDEGTLDVDSSSRNGTYQERMAKLIQDLHNFADGLSYQMQFRDERVLDSIDRNGRGFLRMMDSCLEKERRQNTNAGAPLGTWDASSALSMYYRSRPRRGEEDT